MFVSASLTLRGISRVERCSRWSKTPIVGIDRPPPHRQIDDHIRGERLSRLVPIVQSTAGYTTRSKPKNHCVRMLGTGSRRRRDRHAGRCAGARPQERDRPSTWAARKPRPGYRDGEALTTGTALIGGYDKALPVQIAMMDHIRGRQGRRLDRAGGGGGPRAPARAALSGPACMASAGAEKTVTEQSALGSSARTASSAARWARRRGRQQAPLLERVGRPREMDATAAGRGNYSHRRTAMFLRGQRRDTERGRDAGDSALVAMAAPGRCTQ